MLLPITTTLHLVEGQRPLPACQLHRAVQRTLPNWAGIDGEVEYGARSPLGAAFTKSAEERAERDRLHAAECARARLVGGRQERHRCSRHDVILSRAGYPRDVIEDIKKRALHRTSILEGQMRGVARMIENEDYCVDIITLSLAVQKSLGSLNKLLVENHLRTHVSEMYEAGGDQRDAAVAELTTLGEGVGLVFGTPAAAQDQNAFAVTTAFAEEHDVATLSDLAAACGGIVLGGPPECPERPFCQPGLEETYGLDVGEFVSLDAGGPLTKTALQQGQIALGLVFSSDAALAG